MTGKKEELIARLLTFSTESSPKVDTAKHVVPAVSVTTTVTLGTAPAAATSTSPKPSVQQIPSVTPVSSNPLSSSMEMVGKTEEEKLKERAKRFGLPVSVQSVKKPADSGIKSPNKPTINVNAGFLKTESVVSLWNLL